MEVIVSLGNVPCTHALANHGNVHRTHGNTDQGRHGPDALGHAVGCNLVGAKQGHHAGQGHFHQLEDTAFHPVGNGNPQDGMLQSTVQPEDPVFHVPHRVHPGETQGCHHHCGKAPGHQGRPGHPGNPSVEYKDAQTVAHHVNQVGQNGNVHGGTGFPQAPVQCRACIINGQGRVGIGRNPQVGHAGLHHRGLHPAKKQEHQPLIERQHQGGADHRKQEGGGQQLGRRGSCLGQVLPANVLADDHGTAGS